MGCDGGDKRQPMELDYFVSLKQVGVARKRGNLPRHKNHSVDVEGRIDCRVESEPLLGIARAVRVVIHPDIVRLHEKAGFRGSRNQRAWDMAWERG
eukprot:scaffold142493_cov112-Phaeocystis_antarctica.AAC.2